MVRLVDSLRARAAERFVGRTEELALIDASLCAEPPPVSVFFVHGPGGVGKTSLLERVCARAAAQGLDAVRLDARDIEPTTHGVLRSLGAALGLPDRERTLDRVLAHCAQVPRRLLLLDTFECLAHLEAWLRDALLAQLPEATRVIVAGRGTPEAAWTTDALWREGARVIALRNLGRADSARYLRARGIAAVHHEAIVRLTHGHPLALTLLADIVAASGTVPDTLGTDVVRQLAQRFTAQAPTPLHRRALEICAHARVTTEPLLADTVDRAQAHALFDWLASLGFVERGPTGLFPHDLVRDAIDDELYWRDRDTHRRLRAAVLQHLVERLSHDGRQAFDVVFLYRHTSGMQPFVDFRALGSMVFERAVPDDLPALRSLVQEQLPAAQHAAVERWFTHPAVRTWAVRPPRGALAAATLSVDLARLDADERGSDAVFDAVWRALAVAAPPQPGDLQLLARWNIARGGQLCASAAMNGIQTAMFYQWMTVRRLGAFVICVEEPDFWRPVMDVLRFARLAGADVALDGLRLGCYVHDWRAEPVAHWLGRMGAGAPAGAAARPAEDGAAFERAVRDALRAWHDRRALGASPLLGCNAVRAAVREGEAPADALRRVLHEAAQRLCERPRDAKFWRALELTYFRPAGSQELAAERLGVPFGTYRYQLSAGIERVAQALREATDP